MGPVRSLPSLEATAAVIAAVVFLGMFVWHAAVEPVDHGYIRYLAIADGMVRSGDWVVQHLDGRIYLDKPPFFPWLVALPGVLFGHVPAWAQHAPNLLAALLLTAWTQAAGARLFGSRAAGLVAAGVTLTSYRIQVALHDERLDLLFAALLTGVFYHGFVALTAGAPGWRRAAQFGAGGILLACATLTKGPVALALALPGVLVFAAGSRRLRVLASRDALVGAMAFVAVSLPWFLLLLHRLGQEELRSAIAATRFFTRFQGPFHYAAHIHEELAPWSLFLPVLVAAWVWRIRPAWPREGRWFVACWTLGVLVVLHLIAAKHPRYLLPAFPALALLLASLWYGPGEGVQRSLPLRLRSLATTLLLVVLAVASAGALVGLLWIPLARGVIGPMAAAVLAVAGFAILRSGGEPLRRLQALLACSLLVWAGVDGVRAWNFQRAPCWPGARRALAGVPADAVLGTLALDETRRLEVSFAADRAVREIVSASRLKRWGKGPAPAGGRWLVTTPDASAHLAADPTLAVRPMGRFCLHRERRVLLRLEKAPEPSPVESRFPPAAALKREAISQAGSTRRPGWSWSCSPTRTLAGEERGDAPSAEA
jgi:4-amino-4-deoxy-L-arabinose transferase-like glycosyltransferase